MTKVKLQDGIELNAYKTGIEDQLVKILNDPAGIPGKDVWFDFDPKVKIKIGGYTDKTGDSLSNLKLSQDRATAVLTSLKTAKANVSQIVGAEGYESQYAKVSKEASDEKRKKDRRIAISVRSK